MAQQFIRFDAQSRFWFRLISGATAPFLTMRRKAGLIRRILHLLYRKKKMEAAERYYKRAHSDLLSQVDLDQINGFYLANDDPTKDVLLSIFERTGRPDTELLRRVLPEAVAKQVIHPTTEVHVVIPGDRSRKEPKIRKGFTSYASNYHGGYVDKIFVSETADETETRVICERRGVAFPDDAFPGTNVITLRFNPSWGPVDR